jgi:hypothetical protein
MYRLNTTIFGSGRKRENRPCASMKQIENKFVKYYILCAF